MTEEPHAHYFHAPPATAGAVVTMICDCGQTREATTRWDMPQNPYMRGIPQIYAKENHAPARPVRPQSLNHRTATKDWVNL